MLGVNKKYVDVFHKNKQCAPSHSLAGVQILICLDGVILSKNYLVPSFVQVCTYVRMYVAMYLNSCNCN